MSNLKDDFERMLQLAEFGAKRHDERRQIEFRVFIAYVTLLVLAFSQIDKVAELNFNKFILLILLIVVHFSYVSWLSRMSRAQANEASRRNFYLKKVECILHHLWKNPCVPFTPRKNVYITVDLGREIDKKSECSEKGKISEYELFEQYEPPIELVKSRFWRYGFRPWRREFWREFWPWKGWSAFFQVSAPTAVGILIGYALWHGKKLPWWQRLIQELLGLGN